MGGGECALCPCPCCHELLTLLERKLHEPDTTALTAVVAGAMGIDAETWSQLEAGVNANEGGTIRPVGGDECRKRCGLQ